MQRMRASRSCQSQLGRRWRLARTADCGLWAQKMTKRESKLLSRWPEYRRRGKVAFVWLHRVLPSALGIVIGVLLYGAISPRQFVYWGSTAFMLTVVGVVSGVRGALLWDRIESFYAEGQRQQS